MGSERILARIAYRVAGYMMKSIDLEGAVRHLEQHGYVVLERVLDQKRLQRIRGEVDRLFERERGAPFDPGDGPAGPDDTSIEAFISENYTASAAEVARIMKRVRHTRALNGNTSWPVPPNQVMKLFFHLPLLFDQDRSQRIMNLPAKSDAALHLVEEPHILTLVRGVLGADCVLSDLSATSIGAHAAEGGAWHVDVPLGQLPEPLPDFPLTIQNAWMLDDFTAEKRRHLRGAPKPQAEEETQLVPPTGAQRSCSDRARRIGGRLVVQHLAPLGSQYHRPPPAGPAWLLFPFLGQTLQRLSNLLFQAKTGRTLPYPAIPAGLLRQRDCSGLTLSSRSSTLGLGGLHRENPVIGLPGDSPKPLRHAPESLPAQIPTIPPHHLLQPIAQMNSTQVVMVFFRELDLLLQETILQNVGPLVPA